MALHGGDIYRNKVEIDFSVNGNPLGVPQSVREALIRAVGQCSAYPDMETAALKEAVARMLAVPKEYLLFGNGASELFMAVVHGIRPKKTVIPAPSFYGYEYAARAAESEIRYCGLNRENGFHVTKDLCDNLTEDVDLLFLANPSMTSSMHRMTPSSRLRQAAALGTALSSRIRSTVQPPISARRTDGSPLIYSGCSAMAEYPWGNSFTSRIHNRYFSSSYWKHSG